METLTTLRPKINIVTQYTSSTCVLLVYTSCTSCTQASDAREPGPGMWARGEVHVVRHVTLYFVCRPVAPSPHCGATSRNTQHATRHTPTRHAPRWTVYRPRRHCGTVHGGRGGTSSPSGSSTGRYVRSILTSLVLGVVAPPPPAGTCGRS